MDSYKKVLEVVRSTRDITLPSWGATGILAQKDGSAVNIVTELDIKVEEYTKEALGRLHPDISFVGEEGSGDRTASRFWLMDPIDGTQHYVRGLPFSTTMLALIEDGKVVFSAIYDFIHDDMYSAVRGEGAFKNDERISVSTRSLREAYVFFESNQSKEENRELRWQLRKRMGVVETLSAGWEYTMIASGKIDGRVNFEPYGKDYDFAPGALLVSEAGGIVANIGSNEYDYRDTSLLAVNPVIYKELTEGEGALFPVTK